MITSNIAAIVLCTVKKNKAPAKFIYILNECPDRSQKIARQSSPINIAMNTLTFSIAGSFFMVARDLFHSTLNYVG